MQYYRSRTLGGCVSELVNESARRRMFFGLLPQTIVDKSGEADVCSARRWQEGVCQKDPLRRRPIASHVGAGYIRQSRQDLRLCTVAWMRRPNALSLTNPTHSFADPRLTAGERLDAE